MERGDIDEEANAADFLETLEVFCSTADPGSAGRLAAAIGKLALETLPWQDREETFAILGGECIEMLGTDQRPCAEVVLLAIARLEWPCDSVSTVVEGARRALEDHGVDGPASARTMARRRAEARGPAAVLRLEIRELQNAADPGAHRGVLRDRLRALAEVASLTNRERRLLDALGR